MASGGFISLSLVLFLTVYLSVDQLSLSVRLRDLVSRSATSIPTCNPPDFEILPVRFSICDPSSFIVVWNPLDIRATHTYRVDLRAFILIAMRIVG